MKTSLDGLYREQRETVRQEQKIRGDEEPKKRTPWQVWGLVLSSSINIRITVILLAVYTLLVCFLEFEREMFVDQFIGLSLIGNIFIWIQFNVLLSIKIILGTI